ncbi:MAG: hypothetical protein J2O48_14000 [Solirubrobacterales bacterium]|nr:hypothetical protein [Solirubrobacterales bacterium]
MFKSSIAIAGTLLLTGAAPALASAPAKIADCNGHAQAKPGSLVLACGDANDSLQKLQWKGWGAPRATATAIESKQSCTPSCADGKPVRKHVRVTASELRHGRYTQLSVNGQRFSLTAHGPVSATPAPTGQQPA